MSKGKMCEMRLRSDFEEFADVSYLSLVFPKEDDIMKFVVRVSPEQGIWRCGKFDFQFVIPNGFPFDRPLVTCMTRIWHPNIEETGAVCLNILRDSYTPVMSILQLAIGLQFLFTDPNPASPLNQEASSQLEVDPEGFEKKAKEYIRLYCPQ